MHEVQNSAIARHVRGAAEILEVDKVRVEAAGLVVLDHDVSLLQIARVKPGFVQAADLRSDSVRDLFAAMHVAPFDFAGAEHEAAQRIGIDERSADEIRGANRTGLVQIHGSQRFWMREATSLQHSGARERSPGARAANSGIDAEDPGGNFDALYERRLGSGQLDESCARPRFSFEHAKAWRRHKFV